MHDCQEKGGWWASLVGIELFRCSPITGVGIGNFRAYRKEFLDGDPHDAHSLPGQLLGETGLLGGTAFALMIGATMLNCRRVRLITRGRACGTLNVLAELSFAVRTSLLLLLFEGLALHNVYRFNYLWLAAFSLLAWQFAARICESEQRTFDEEPGPTYSPSRLIRLTDKSDPGDKTCGYTKHVAFFLPDMEFGGVERVAINLATGLADAGVKVDFVLAKASGAYMHQIPQQVHVVDLEASRVLFSVTKLARYLRRNRPDWLLLANNYAIIAGLWAARLCALELAPWPSITACFRWKPVRLARL